ncbi:hypothetical protein ACUNWD_02605 [Sunxiuqinia sp. A32]|uniref:hypothetical protein n=1 Tax=Sunxiuqinia sp. A32 TaxID=3461496 RepID=UPI004045B63F
MIKVELVRRTFAEVYVYSLYVLAIAVLISLTFNYEYISHQTFIIILLIVLASLRLIPVMRLKRHKKYGYLIVEDERIDIERYRRKASYEISNLMNLKIRLTGYDGQPMYKHMDHLRPRDMDMKKLVNGLGNYIRFNYKLNRYKLQLYFDKENQYEEFKSLMERWKEKYPSIKMNVKR